MFVVTSMNNRKALRVSKSKARKRQNRKRQSHNRERRIARRLKRTEGGRSSTGKPEMSMSRMKLDVSDRINAHGVGGLGLIHQMVQRLDAMGAARYGALALASCPVAALTSAGRSPQTEEGLPDPPAPKSF